MDQLVAGLRALEEQVAASRSLIDHAEQRLEDLMQMISALVALRYDDRAEVTERNDIFDGFAAGLNMLAEELAHSTVSRNQVNNIIESMSDLLIVTGMDGRIQTVNRAACDLTRRDRTALLDQPVELVFEDLSLHEVIQESGVRHREMTCRAKDGSQVPVSLSAAVMRDRRGASEGIVCVARDLTEMRRVAEEQRRLREAVQRQAIILEELATPIIPISDRVLVLPLIGTVDEQRTAQILEALLHGVVSRRARMAILDVTGVRTFDEAGIAGILHVVRAVQLLGAEVALTGIRPDVAITLVHGGYDLGSIKTFGSLQDGIVHAMRDESCAARR